MSVFPSAAAIITEITVVPIITDTIVLAAVALRRVISQRRVAWEYDGARRGVEDWWWELAPLRSLGWWLFACLGGEVHHTVHHCDELQVLYH